MPDESSVDERRRHEAETFAAVPPAQPNTITRMDANETIAPGAPRPASSNAAQTVNSIEQFVDCLSLSGLMTGDELKAFNEALLPDESVNDIQTFVEALIRKKKLTSYQADVLRQGQTRGLVFGNYVVLDKLGEGGMGVVFKAHHRRMKRMVALKVLPQALTTSPDALARFHREVEAAAKLTHPNIAAAYDADEAAGVHFLVMEYVDGLNLSQHIRKNGPAPLARALHFVLQAARGLGHAHRCGVVHRDIKPGNLLVDQTGVVKILDMGLARFDTQQDEGQPELTELTQSGRVMGTVDYMAPEQALDAKHADHRADIYSLGCTLFFLLTGRSMSPDGTLTQKLLWHQTSEAPSLLEICPGSPAALNTLFQAMLAKKPADRVQSMAEVISKLESILRGLSPEEAALALPPAGTDHYQEPTIDLSKRNQATIVDRRTVTGASPLVPGVADTRTKHRRVAWIAAIATGAIGAAFAAVLTLLPSRGAEYSQLILDVDQPDAEVFLNEVSIPDKDGNVDGHMEVQVEQGKKHQIRIIKEGFEQHKQEFEARSSDPQKILVTMRPFRRNIARPAQAPPPPQAPQTDMAQFLRWVFTQGGSVILLTGQGDLTGEIRRAGDVPAGAFTIRTIKLDSAGINDAELARLSEVGSLQNLSLKENAISDTGLSHLAKLTALWSLDLSNTKVTDAGLERLSGLTELRDLNLQKLAITSAGLAHLGKLRKLENIYLSDTKVTDEGLQHLAPLEGLKQVSLNGTTVTLAGVDGLKAAFPKVKVEWDIPDIDREVARRLLAMGARLSLSVGDAPATMQIRRLSDMPAERFVIRGLDLSGKSQTSDADLVAFAGLAKLEQVNLDGTSVTTDGLEHLKKVKTLRTIELGGLQVADSAVDSLKAAIPGSDVRWTPNSERKTAEWVMSLRGKISVATPDGEIISDVDQSKQLPNGRFSLRQVHLDGNQELTDADLARFRGLTGLEALFLNGTKIGDAGVSELSTCTGLRDLGLNETKVSDAGLVSVGGLHSLRQLFLAGTAISDQGLEQLKMLRQLTHLSIARTSVTDAGLQQLARHGNLSWLCLSETPLTDASLAQLAKYTNLKELLVNATHISDAGVEELSTALPNCKVQGNAPNPQRAAARWALAQGGTVSVSTGDLRKLTELPRGACTIKKIDLAQLNKVTNEGLANLAACTAIEELDLSKTALSDEGLKHIAGLTNLARLSLAGTRTTDAGLLQLRGLVKLRALNLQGTRVTLAQFKELSSWIGLQELQLDTTKVSDRTLANLAPFTSLLSVNLSDNPNISDRGVSQLNGLAKLQAIGLRGTMVSDAAVAQLTRYPELRSIDLASTSITDAGAAQLRALRKLQYLQLYGTGVTDGTLTALAEVRTLRNLNVAKTRVTDNGVATLKAAIPECRIAKSERRTDVNDESAGGAAPIGDAGGGERIRPFGGRNN